MWSGNRTTPELPPNRSGGRVFGYAILAISITLLGAVLGCGDRQALSNLENNLQADPSAPTGLQEHGAAVVQTGAERLVESDFEMLSGRRVGLIVNHTSAVGGIALADLMHAAPEVELAALFGPEHGIRGAADAGAGVKDTVDALLGVPVFSLYGERRSPDRAILEGLDALVFDIQDVGARFYTYISTMGLSMEAAARAGVEFVVLDRPNPLGGSYVSGFVREEEFKSFVGYYPVPVAHGMTIGELAQMAVGERWGQGLDSLQLTVVPMEGWRRSMQWPDIGETWTPTSPNIPDFEIALVYPGMCFFEGTSVSEGRGTREPFRVIGATWIDGDALAATLNVVGLPGLSFHPHRFTPRSIDGMSLHPKLQDTPLAGVRIDVTQRQAVWSVETGVYVLRAVLRQAQAAGVDEDFFRAAGIDRLAGTRRLRELLLSGASEDDIIESWSDEVAEFSKRRSQYLIYDE